MILLKGPPRTLAQQGRALQRSLARDLGASSTLSPWNGGGETLQPTPRSALIYAGFRVGSREAIDKTVPRLDHLLRTRVSPPVRAVQSGYSAALEACGGSLVGHGLMRTKDFFPEQTASLVKATILIFYGRSPGGGTRLLLHIHARHPAPFTVLVPVSVRSVSDGRFGMAFFAALPPIARHWAYLTKFKFVLGRSFLDHGRRASFLRASCPAPNGFDKAIFPFARATYRFRTTKTLRATLIGGCHVRGR